MKRVMRIFGGALLGLLVLYGIARGSLAEYTPDYLPGTSSGLAVAGGEVGADAPGASSLLRLSWRTRGESVHACRRLSAEEMEELPTHMRREEVCETRILPWELEVEVDGVHLVRDTILPAGARQDRPLYVYRDLPLRPGRHAVKVEFEQIFSDSPSRNDLERERAGANQTPSSLSHSATVELEPGEIALITYDADSRSLVMRQPEAREPLAPATNVQQPESSQ